MGKRNLEGKISNKAGEDAGVRRRACSQSPGSKEAGENQNTERQDHTLKDRNEISLRAAKEQAY